MILDNLAAILLGGATVMLVVRALNGRQAKGVVTNGTLTAPTDPALLAVARSAAPEERLRLLVESGALTGDEYMTLTGSHLQQASQGCRLSILQGGPNKIQDIKALRTVFHLSIRDAKEIVDSLPQTFVTPMPREQALEFAGHLQVTGMITFIT